MIDLKAKIYVAGHKGLVGSAILRKLNKRGYKKIITENKSKLACDCNPIQCAAV